VKKQDILPPRAGETDDEKRFREALNRHAGNLLSTLDAALALRTAPPDVQRTRHLARGHLTDFCLKAMHAHALAAEAAQPAE
jgi:hypothetical protein